MMRKILMVAAVLAGAAVLRSVFADSSDATSNEPAAPPLYRSSVVGTDFDFITDKDPSTFQRLYYVGLKDFEIPDKRGTGKPLVQSAYVFDARFTDGTRVGLALDSAFGSREAAEEDAMRYAPRIGKLPALYRKKLKHIVVHKGGADTTAFAEDKGHFFVLYSDNAAKRIATHDLEETIFHESTHASIQVDHLDEDAWKTAKSLDRTFITDYAKTDAQEDFAESALFAYTLIHHPDRFTPDDRAKIEKQIPNRIAFFKRIYSER